MTNIQINQLSTEQELSNFFTHYPMESIEQMLTNAFAPQLDDLAADEPLSYTQLFYEELMQFIHNSALLCKEIDLKETIIIKEHEHIKNLKMIIYFMKELIPASHIFCSNLSETRIDLLIIIDKYSIKPRNEIDSLLNFMFFAHPNINCTVLTYGHIHSILTVGHLYYSSVCIPENCVYQKKGVGFLARLSMEQYSVVAQQSTCNFNEHLDKAINFLQGAQQYFISNQIKMAAFMLQQACEMCFRSLIICFRGKEIRCHELTVLRKHLSHFAPSIIGSFDPSEKKEIRILTEIQEAYIKSRYDSSYQVCIATLRKHIIAVDQFILISQEIFAQQLLKLRLALA